MKKDKDCITKTQIYSDYFGNNEKECTEKFISSDYINKCAFINNKCIDFPYKYCSDYKGTNKEICESFDIIIMKEIKMKFKLILLQDVFIIRVKAAKENQINAPILNLNMIALI